MLWNRLIAAVPVLKSSLEDAPETYFDVIIPQVFLTYIYIYIYIDCCGLCG